MNPCDCHIERPKRPAEPAKPEPRSEGRLPHRPEDVDAEGLVRVCDALLEGLIMPDCRYVAAARRWAARQPTRAYSTLLNRCNGLHGASKGFQSMRLGRMT